MSGFVLVLKVGHEKRKGCVSVPIWLVLPRCEATNIGCVCSESFRPTQTGLCKFGWVWSLLPSNSLTHSHTHILSLLFIVIFSFSPILYCCLSFSLCHNFSLVLPFYLQLSLSFSLTFSLSLSLSLSFSPKGVCLCRQF